LPRDQARGHRDLSGGAAGRRRHKNRASVTLLLAGGRPARWGPGGQEDRRCPLGDLCNRTPAGIDERGIYTAIAFIDPSLASRGARTFLPRRASTCRGRQATFRLCLSQSYGGRRLVPLAVPVADRIKNSSDCSALSLDATTPTSLFTHADLRKGRSHVHVNAGHRLDPEAETADWAIVTWPRAGRASAKSRLGTA